MRNKQAHLELYARGIVSQNVPFKRGYLFPTQLFTITHCRLGKEIILSNFVADYAKWQRWLLYNCSIETIDDIPKAAYIWSHHVSINTLRLGKNGRHFLDDIFKRIFVIENTWISIEISLKFVPWGSINDIPALVQIIVWRRPGDKPLSEPMMAYVIDAYTRHPTSMSHSLCSLQIICTLYMLYLSQSLILYRD